MMFIVHLCSLFIPFNVTAVHTTEGACVFGGLRYTTALFFLTSLRNRIFFFFASWHRIRASGQRSFLGLECLKSYPVWPKVEIQCFQDMTVKKSVQFHNLKICFIAFYLALLPEDSTGYVSSLTWRELEAAIFLLHRWYMQSCMTSCGIQFFQLHYNAVHLLEQQDLLGHCLVWSFFLCAAFGNQFLIWNIYIQGVT